MKKIKIFIVFCAVQVYCTAQTYFDNYYNTGYNNVTSCYASTTMDSGCVFFNIIEDSITGRYDFGLIKLDKNGNEQIKKSFNMFNQDYLGGTFISATPCSYFSSAQISGGRFIVNKINRVSLDTMRHVIHEDATGNNYGYSLYSFIKLHENKYFLIGTKGNGAFGYNVLLQLDSNLNVVNEININTTISAANDALYTYHALYNPDKKLILLEGFGNLSGQAVFMHIDTLGNPVNAVCITDPSSSTIYYPNGTYSGRIYQISYSHADSSYVVIGGNMMIGKLDANTFASRWHYTYGEGGFSNVLVDAVVLQDGSIVASGGYSPAAPLNLTDVRGALLKTDKDGNLQWFNEYNNLLTGTVSGTYPYSYREFLLGVDTTLEGGFVACGTVLDMPHAKAWAVKTDNMGCGAPNCVQNTSITTQVLAVTVQSISVTTPTDTTGINELEIRNAKLKIYPNPVNEMLNVECEMLNGKQVEIFLYDVLGNTVIHNSTFIIQHSQIDVSELEKGIYFLQVFEKGKLLATQKLMKE